MSQADCVFPTRTARFGVALTFQGALNLRGCRFINSDVLFLKFGLHKGLSKHAKDMRTIEDGCPCPTCSSGMSRALLNHTVTLETSTAHGEFSHGRDSLRYTNGETSHYAAQFGIPGSRDGRGTSGHNKGHIPPVSQGVLCKLLRRRRIPRVVRKRITQRRRRPSGRQTGSESRTRRRRKMGVF